jgi:cytochrome d ubiquinol oxidase subunit II
MSLLANHATQKTIDDLGIALLIGSLIILPALFYLYYSFREKDKPEA